MWYTKSVDEISEILNTNEKMGLDEEEAIKRVEIYGLNKIENKKSESILVRFLKQFNDFMIIILIIASIISAGISYIEGSNEYFDSIIIIAIVIFNAIMGLLQESKAEKAIESLKKMSAPMAKVKRNGKIINIENERVVPGDVVILESGSFVPADCRIINAYNLKIEESSLTGETTSVNKISNTIFEKEIPIGDMKNIAFGGTIVTNGHGEAIVTETGMNTKVGKIAQMIISDEAPLTPIQKRLEQVSKGIGTACLIICFVIFVIGIMKKTEPLEMFMTSVGLAVAAIPEGMPAIVTIMLSIGVTRIAKKNAIIRKLPAVETLGSSRIICSDKTGTLTQNKMKIVQIKGDKDFILELGSMCTECNIIYDNQKIYAEGEATEVAIVNCALDNNINKDSLYEMYPKVNEIPFESSRKLMTTIHRLNNGMYRVITKGAPDVLLYRCSNYVEGNSIFKLKEEKKEEIQNKNNKMAGKALRVLAVAYKDVDALPSKIDSLSVENELNFVGLIGIKDPIREGVIEAIQTCRKAGIKTVMITGDHIITAKAIAKEIGILKGVDIAITGQELDKIPQIELEKNIMKYSVFARVSPEHKVRIVKAFQSTGAVVAMTGDGVNDAPALKNADIGIAMGLNGTDVAKNAADMVLTDDNFVTIVESVKQGRCIYENIRKCIRFLISTNIGEIVTIFVGMLLGMPSPLLAIQLLWINLVTDSIPGIALGLENPDKDIMNKKAIDPKKGIFADGLFGKIFAEGFMIGILTLVAFSIGNRYSLEVGRTMAFVSLGILELVHCFNVRSEESIFKKGILSNKYLLGAFIIGTILQIGVAIIPSVAQVFELTQLNTTQWIYVAIISILPIIIVEIQKKSNEIKFGKVVYSYK